MGQPAFLLPHPLGHAPQFPVGISLKSEHYQDIVEDCPNVDFFEIHAENYMVDGGPHMEFLSDISQKYALSIHGVGMSLGSADGLDRDHLNRFEKLVRQVKPWLVSEHLAWSVKDGVYLNDLLPLPLNKESLSVVSDNIHEFQDKLGRSILIENPSSYLAFLQSDMPEPDFLNQLADETGCGLLLDVNNIYVSGMNMGWDIDDYIAQIDLSKVGEIHLAGHVLKVIEGVELRIDDHGGPVHDDVWGLYQKVTQLAGMKPTLIERDSNIPALIELVDEAVTARQKAKQVIGDRYRQGGLS